jgi:hypothetical protein
MPYKINMDDWSHQQELDYEHIPFKCNLYHEYMNFAQSWPKNWDKQTLPW